MSGLIPVSPSPQEFSPPPTYKTGLWWRTGSVRAGAKATFTTRIRASGEVEEVGWRKGYRFTNREQAEAKGALPEVRPAICSLAGSGSIVRVVEDLVLSDDSTASTIRYSVPVHI